jgi:hypothetical protein
MSSVPVGSSPPSLWATGTAYLSSPVPSVVIYDARLWYCVVGHTAAAAFNSLYWVYISDVALVGDADASPRPVPSQIGIDNAQLARMGGLTLKGNVGADIGIPTDVPLSVIQALIGGGGSGGDVYTRASAEPIGQGQVLTSNISGNIVRAQANSVSNAKIIGLAKTSATSGLPVQIVADYLTLTDWTAATGSVSLSPRADYFLDPLNAGMLSVVVPTTVGQCVVFLGTAIDTTTLAIELSEPILL